MDSLASRAADTLAIDQAQYQAMVRRVLRGAIDERPRVEAMLRMEQEATTKEELADGELIQTDTGAGQR